MLACARHLASSCVLAGLFLTTYDLHVQIPEFGLWWICCSWSECAAEAWISGLPFLAPFLPTPWSDREILILLFVSILQSFYIANHAFALLGDLIFLKYYIMSYDNYVLVLSVRMYITIVLPYSDSCPCWWWYLAYICEGISVMRIYDTVTSPYPRDRGVTQTP